MALIVSMCVCSQLGALQKLTVQDGTIDGPGLAVAASVNLSLTTLGLAGVVAEASNGGGSAGHTSLANAGGLNGESLPHDGASLTQQLELGDGTTARGDLRASRGRQSAEGGRGCLLEKGAHGLGLTKDGVHGQGIRDSNQ